MVTHREMESIRSRLRVAHSIIYCLIVVGTVGCAVCFASIPRYAYSHESASIDDLRRDLAFHVDAERRKQALDILTVRARECIDAIRSSRSAFAPKSVDEALRMISEELTR